jgi:hypothetical protein
MYYDMESLTKIATDAQLNVELSKMGPRTSKAIIRAFDKGYLTSVRGEGALYHSLLADQVKLPIMQFSKKGKWWDTLYLKNIDTRCIPQLSEWWQADRVLFRLENPDQWNQYTSKNPSGRYSHWRGEALCEEPDWEEEIKTGKQFNVGIFGGKELEMFDLIAKVYTSTDEYKEKKEKLIHMIEAQETIKVNYVF